jgi:hypothetical protein
MKYMRYFFKLTWVAIMVCGIGALNSCTAPKVALEHRTPLVKNQPYEGTQQSMDYQLAYRYIFSKGGASQPDQIEFTGKLTPRRGLDSLTVRLHLLDASGKVLATQVLYAPGAGQGAGRSTINRTIEVPPDAVTLAFSHSAKDKPILF